jgi:hypothetical protein
MMFASSEIPTLPITWHPSHNEVSEPKFGSATPSGGDEPGTTTRGCSRHLSLSSTSRS